MPLHLIRRWLSERQVEPKHAAFAGILCFSVLILSALIIFGISRRTPAATSAPGITYPLVSQFAHFEPIEASKKFESLMYQAIEKSYNTTSDSNRRELSRSLVNFLTAFQTGDIHAYWRFRNPRSHTAQPGKQFAAFSARLKVLQPTNVGAPSFDNPESVLAYYWDFSRKGGAFSANISSCVTCATGVALDKIEIHTSVAPALASSAGIASYIRKSTGKPGVTVYDGLVRFDEGLSGFTGATGDYLLVYLPIALKSEAVARAHIVFYAPGGNGPFVPVRIGAEGADRSSRWLIF